MEQNHLKSFEVSGFKKFTDLKIDNIGQFNLIIGDNNVGKTSLLEALCVNENNDNFIFSLANINFFTKRINNLKLPFINLYFNYTQTKFPKLFSIKIINEANVLYDFELISNEESKFKIRGLEAGSFKDYIILNENYQNYGYSTKVPYISMGSFYDHELTEQYSKNIQLFVDKKDRLMNSLKYLIPNIKNIEVNNSYSNTPILLIAEAGKNQLSPLATFGDGALKLFRIALSLYSNNYLNRLMIDEIDTGIHHSHLKDFTKSLLQVATAEQKQIFATTHSKECIESFTKALEETGMQNEGRIIRLAETKHGIKAYTMEFAEFENSILAESEIR
jgi:AAA15 family ATPase/GTPase